MALILCVEFFRSPPPPAAADPSTRPEFLCQSHPLLLAPLPRLMLPPFLIWLWQLWVSPASPPAPVPAPPPMPPPCDLIVLLRRMVDVKLVSHTLVAVECPRSRLGDTMGRQHKYRWKCCRKTPDTQYRATGFAHELRKLERRRTNGRRHGIQLAKERLRRGRWTSGWNSPKTYADHPEDVPKVVVLLLSVGIQVEPQHENVVGQEADDEHCGE